MNEHGDICNRFVELWNLVFMQFYHHLDGTRTPLPAPSIDTGLGFERAVRVIQGTDTLYETDLFTPLVAKIEQLSGSHYGADRETTYAIRAVAEHGRSAAFLIADGVVPGNEGRGYVLRRIIRRAIRHGRRLGLDGLFMGDVASAAIARMEHVYPELRQHEEFILTVLRLEEERFQEAFESGLNMLTEALEGVSTLSGEIVFRLWDTYGFPAEMTEEIAREHGVGVDLEGFEREMASQRERGRASARFGGDRAKIRVYESLGVGATQFLGYEQLTASSVVIGLVSHDESVNQVNEGQGVEIALVETPFYAEGGGQIGDAGEMVGPDGRIEITDTQTVMPEVIMHFGTVVEGSVALGDTVEAYVDPIRREDTGRKPLRDPPAARRAPASAGGPRQAGGVAGRAGPPPLRLQPRPAGDGRRAAAGAAPCKREDPAECPGHQERGHLHLRRPPGGSGLLRPTSMATRCASSRSPTATPSASRSAGGPTCGARARLAQFTSLANRASEPACGGLRPLVAGPPRGWCGTASNATTAWSGLSRRRSLTSKIGLRRSSPMSTRCAPSETPCGGAFRFRTPRGFWMKSRTSTALPSCPRGPRPQMPTPCAKSATGSATR